MNVRGPLAVLLTLAFSVSLAGCGLHASGPAPSTSGGRTHERKPPSVRTVSAAPFALLVATDGKTVEAPLGGRPIVVEFFATWCPYCAYDARYYLPRFASRVQGAGGVFYAVDASTGVGLGVPGPLGHPALGKDGSYEPAPPNQEEQASLAALRRYDEIYRLDYPTYYDPGLRFSQSAHIPAYPYFLFIDAKGQVVKALVGWQPDSTLWRTYQLAFR